MLQFYPAIFVCTYAASEPWTWISLSMKCNTQKWRRGGVFSPLAFGVFKPSLQFKELQSEYCSTCTQPFIFCTMFFSQVVIWERKRGGKNPLRSSPASNRSCSSMQCPPKVYVILACIQIRLFFVYPPLISADYCFCVITPNNSVSIGWRIAFPSNVLIKNDHRSYSFHWHFAHAAVCKASCLSDTVPDSLWKATTRLVYLSAMLLTPPVTCCVNSRSDRRLLPPLRSVLRCAATALPLARAMPAAPGSEWSFGVFPCAPPLKTNTCLICFRLCLRFTASVPSHTFCGEASATEEVVFENATCGEPFLRRKMSFRAPEGKKTHTHT